MVEQVHERVRHLPSGMQQHIKIDARGQTVSAEQRADVMRRIIEKSNGLLKDEHIKFMEPQR